MSPMSWYGGSQETICASGPCSSQVCIARRLCIRFALPTTTPLGVDVEPEVYCRKAGVSFVTSGSRQSSAMSRASSSLAVHRSPASPAALGSAWPARTASRTARVVRAWRAPESRTTAASREAVRPARVRSGG